jgi:hypothetical protein
LDVARAVTDVNADQISQQAKSTRVGLGVGASLWALSNPDEVTFVAKVAGKQYRGV